MLKKNTKDQIIIIDYQKIFRITTPILKSVLPDKSYRKLTLEGCHDGTCQILLKILLS